MPVAAGASPPRSRPDTGPAPAGRVVVGLSGGVDSSVALLLLKRRGVDVRAVFMKNWDEDDAAGECPAERDLADAWRVCERLDVPLSTVNLSSEYWDDVFVSFIDAYRSGLTPNPDVLCNRAIKFRAFADFAADRGADRIATGHYARIERAGGRYRLLRGQDPGKDQTYFLHLLDQEQLARAVFPIGALDKHEVRRMARDAGLENHGKRDSTGVCFIGERNFPAFLKRFITPSPGPIESLEGRTVGRHDGLPFYTIGQRQGLGLGGTRDGDGRPWYVAAKDRDRNALLVVQGADHPALLRASLVAESVHWIAGAAPPDGLECTARIRHRQPDQPCALRHVTGRTWQVRFTAPQWAIAPGQSVVFYAGEECLGGGTIRAATADA